MVIMKKFLPAFIILLLLLVIKNNVVFILGFLKNGSVFGNLQKTLASEQKQNQFLTERLYYVKGDRFVTDQAQNKLGMLKPGEYFVIAPTAEPLNRETQTTDDRPNWKKWLDLFL